jgi:hypothetical protein
MAMPFSLILFYPPSEFHYRSLRRTLHNYLNISALKTKLVECFLIHWNTKLSGTFIVLQSNLISLLRDNWLFLTDQINYEMNAGRGS